MKRPDFHVHYFPGLPGSGSVPEALSEAAASADALLAKVKANGADGMVLLARPYEQRELCELQNEMLYRVMNEHPGEVTAFAAVAPSSWGKAAADAEALLEKGFAGIGMLDPTAQRFSLNAPVVSAVANICAGENAVLSFYTSFSVGEDFSGKSKILPVQWMEFIEEHRDTKILLAHYGSGLPFYGLMKEVAGKLSNVWFDTSPDNAVWRNNTYRAAAGFLGSEEKLLYGSNLPFFDGACPGGGAPKEIPAELAEVFAQAEMRRAAAVRAGREEAAL